MIVTVTMNPALDKTADVVSLCPGALNRLRNVRIDAGGKGVNVSKLIKVLGGESVCTGFVGGSTGCELIERVAAFGLSGDFLKIDGVTRTNLKVIDKDSNLTELNEPGVKVGSSDLSALLDKTSALAGEGGLVVLSGSLPREAPVTTYRDFTEKLKAVGLRVILDADGPAFREGLKAKPDLVKPNDFELLQYFELPSDTNEEVLPGLCLKLLDKGVQWVVLSLGSRGAIFATDGNLAKVRTLKVEVRSTVGAGDSMVGAAAFALEQGLGFEETLRLCMAASVGAVTTEGTNPPSKELIEDLFLKFDIKYIKG
jgi:1-phosphofructokinase